MNRVFSVWSICAVICLLVTEAFAQAPREIQIPSKADPETPQACLFWAPRVPAGETRPLLVNLHTWSADYSQDRTPWWEEAVSREWFLIQPDFQGVNNRPEAGGSALARQQILEARDWALQNHPVDPQRVYIAGVSGGGHMTMLMAAYHPDMFSAASSWCGPSDLADWYRFHTRDGVEEPYARMISACCGGPPGRSGQVDEQYRDRSPLFHLHRVGELPLDLNTGVQDGKTGSVPIHHTLRAYNVVAMANGDPTISEEEMNHLWNTGRVANPLPSDLAGDRDYRRRVLMRRETGHTRVTIFEGGHEAFPETACRWLSRQSRAVTLPDTSE